MIIHNATLTGSISMQAPPVISGSLTLTGSINATGDITASSARFSNIITAQTLVVQTVSSSVSYISGSTQFGSSSVNTHQFTGSVFISSSATYALDVTGAGRFTGNLTTNARLKQNVVGNGAQNTYDITSTNSDGSSNNWSIGSNQTVDNAFQISGNGNQRLAITQAGSVGIGTTSPAYTLDVNGISKSSGSIISSNNSSGTPSTSNTLWMAESNTNTNWQLYIGSSANSFPGGFSILQSTNARMVIASGSGYVGVGTTTPTSSLNIVKSDNTTAAIGSFTANNLTQQTDIWYGGIKMGGTNANVDLNLASKGTGLVNITGAATFSSTVAATTYNRATAGAGYLNGGYSSIETVSTTGPIYCIGPSYVPTSTSTSTMYGVGYSYNGFTGAFGPASLWSFYVVGGGTVGVTLGSDGNGYFRADVTAYYSDRRLKTNIREIDNAIDKVMKLGGYYYNPNDLAVELKATNNQDERVGVMAQEVMEVLPHAVKDAPFDRTGTYKTVQYEKLVPLLIQAIKEQQLQIEELKTIINGFTK